MPTRTTWKTNKYQFYLHGFSVNVKVWSGFICFFLGALKAKRGMRKKVHPQTPDVPNPPLIAFLWKKRLQIALLQPVQFDEISFSEYDE
jgi:hypothetical protein